MRITHISDWSLTNGLSYSGTSFWISKALEQANVEVSNWEVTPAQKLLPPFQEIAFRFKKLRAKFSKGGYYDENWSEVHAIHIANVLNKSLPKIKTDVILTSISPICAAYLDTSTPIVHWSDSSYSVLTGFYPSFRNHHSDINRDGHLLTTNAFFNSKLLIFSSQWAARSAIEIHGISKDKVKVVPFGPNLAINHTLCDVKEMIRKRPKDKIKILFVGLGWYRKGGSIVLEVAQELHSTGHPVEVTLVGSFPEKAILPDYVKVEGQLYKDKLEDVDKLKTLYQESHFLFVPSVAECCAIVFAEANAFGVPCITTYVGGNSEAIKDNLNGMTFSLEATVEDYCDYIINVMRKEKNYEALAMSSYHEYETRLNWRTAGNQVKNHIEEMLENIHSQRMSNKSPKEFFKEIYENQIWNFKNPDIPLSGHGSSIGATKEIQGYLRELISSLKLGSLLDLGCGDLTWIPKAISSSFDYVGVDVYDRIIQSHHVNHPYWQFKIIDAIKESLPSADLILIKDVIIHLTNNQIKKLLSNVADSDFKYLLISMTIEKRIKDIIDPPWFYSEVNLRDAPFHFSHFSEQIILDTKQYILMNKQQLIFNLSI